jgi:two-component system nitrate/nitrite response regulator NarL
MSTMVKTGSPASGVTPRILVTGSDLLAGALSSALERHGFTTTHSAPSTPDLEHGLDWKPDLVLFDARSFDQATGAAAVRQLCRRGFAVCVIDTSHESARRAAWLHAGATESVDGNDPFEQLLLTIIRVLRVCPTPRPERRSAASLASMRAGPHAHDSQLERFASLTDREQFVLAELLEGHCAEEIAKTAYVSISTVRSQIKSILQKLGVNSQLAAVALARRAGWSLNRRRLTDPKPSSERRSRAS